MAARLQLQTNECLANVNHCQRFATYDKNLLVILITEGIINAMYMDEEKTYRIGFVTLKNHYQWKCLPFGHKSCPGIFQRIL